MEIAAPEVLRKSQQKNHPILRFSGSKNDKIEGVLFEVTDKEILLADEYETENYKRIETTFSSGNNGYIYIEN